MRRRRRSAPSRYQDDDSILSDNSNDEDSFGDVNSISQSSDEETPVWPVKFEPEDLPSEDDDKLGFIHYGGLEGPHMSLAERRKKFLMRVIKATRLQVQWLEADLNRRVKLYRRERELYMVQLHRDMARRRKDREEEERSRAAQAASEQRKKKRAAKADSDEFGPPGKKVTRGVKPITTASEPPSTLPCAFEGCQERRLPLTQWCYCHILNDPKQVLFVPCTFISPVTGKECGYPVMKHLNPPYCAAHADLVKPSLHPEPDAETATVTPGQAQPTTGGGVSPVVAEALLKKLRKRKADEITPAPPNPDGTPSEASLAPKPKKPRKARTPKPKPEPTSVMPSTIIGPSPVPIAPVGGSMPIKIAPLPPGVQLTPQQQLAYQAQQQLLHHQQLLKQYQQKHSRQHTNVIRFHVGDVAEEETHPEEEQEPQFVQMPAQYYYNAVPHGQQFQQPMPAGVQTPPAQPMPNDNTPPSGL